jgi:hypothetical protein
MIAMQAGASKVCSGTKDLRQVGAFVEQVSRGWKLDRLVVTTAGNRPGG